jgi:hypothetical protein
MLRSYRPDLVFDGADARQRKKQTNNSDKGSKDFS